METNEMPTKLLDELQKDETVVWSGRAGKFKLMNPASKKSLVTRWIVCAALLIVFEVLYVLLARVKAGVMPAVVIILVLVALYFAFLPALDRNRLLKKTLYYITNQRIIVLANERDFFAIAKNGTNREFAANCGGGTDALFGTAAGIPAEKRFSAACVPKKNSDGSVIGLVLYNVGDIDALKAAL